MVYLNGCSHEGFQLFKILPQYGPQGLLRWFFFLVIPCNHLLPVFKFYFEKLKYLWVLVECSSRGSEWGFGMAEWVKCDTEMVFGPKIRVDDDDFIKRMYEGSIEGGGMKRGNHQWFLSKERMTIGERDSTLGIDNTGRECLIRESWRCFFHGHPLGGVPIKGQGVRSLNR